MSAAEKAVHRTSAGNGERSEGAGKHAPQREKIVGVVRNETLAKLRVRGESGRDLYLSPLETYELREGRYLDLKADLDELSDRRLVLLAEPPTLPTPRFKAVVFATPALLPLLYVAILVDNRGLWVAFFAAAAAVAGGMAWYAAHEREQIARWQVWPMLLVLLATAGLTTVAMYFGTNVRAQITNSGMSGFSLIDLTLVARTLQWLFIVLAAALPAGLFFLFDRTKSGVLRERFERDIMRFDASLTTVADVRARYGGIMGEVFGPDQRVTDVSESSSGRASLRYSAAGRTAPIVVASLLLTIGWLIALMNPDIKQLRSAENVSLLFEPQRSPIVFAFLGAYSFAIWHLFRGYTRSDLRPKTYTHVCVRLLTAFVFGWVLEIMFFGDSVQAQTGERSLLVLAFGVGLTPEWLIVAVEERMRSIGRMRGGATGEIAEREPLTRLQGIDIYDRGRLLEEGVNNVEALAHHRIPELMLQTRIPAGRIVDWSDQAILALHVGKDEALAKLRNHGIRTATDLLAARNKGENVNATPLSAQIAAIADAIDDEQWIQNLLWWHQARNAKTPTLALADGRLQAEPDPTKPSRPGHTLQRDPAESNGWRAAILAGYHL